MESIGKEPLKKSKKSKRKLANEKILKNLANFINDLPPEEQKFFKNALNVKKMLNDPIIKLIAIEKPKEIINYKVADESDP